jgi:hypothetical protein
LHFKNNDPEIPVDPVGIEVFLSSTSFSEYEFLCYFLEEEFTEKR